MLDNKANYWERRVDLLGECVDLLDDGDEKLEGKKCIVKQKNSDD